MLYLRLVDESATVGGHVDERALGDFPDGLVDSLVLVWDLGNVLDGARVGHDAILDILIPNAELDEVLEKPRVDNLELTGENAARVQVGLIGGESKKKRKKEKKSE